MNIWTERLRAAIQRGDPIDLRDVVDGLEPGLTREAIALIRQYGDCQRARYRLLDFEEIRRALPWIFESPELLEAAVNVSIDVAAALGQDARKHADAIAASHPLARKCVVRLQESWASIGPPGDPFGRDLELPCGFGDAFDKDEPRFRLEKLLGRTPRSALYEATDLWAGDTGLAETVWVNVFRSELSDESTTGCRPRLLGIEGLAQERQRGRSRGGCFYIAGEGSVRHSARVDDALSRSALNATLRQLAEIAQALARIHANGWIHGDVSPRNLAYSETGDLCLLWREPGEQATMHDVESAEYGPLNPGSCMAPEVFNGKNCTPASEVYQFGALMAWVIARRLVNGARFDDAIERFGGTSGRELPSLPHVPTAMRLLTLECLNDNPGERPVSMTSVWDRIERYLANEPPARSAPLDVHIGMWIRRHYRSAGITLAMFAAVAALALSLIADRHQSRLQSMERTAAQERRQMADLHNVELQALRDLLAESLAINQGADLRERVAEERVRQAEDTIRSSVSNTITVIRDWQREIREIESTDPAKVLYILSLLETLDAADDELRDALLEDSTGLAVAEADRHWNSGARTLSTALWHVIAAQQLRQGGNESHAEHYLERARSIMLALPDDLLPDSDP